MSRHPSRARTLQLALIAAAAVSLGACSKSDPETTATSDPAATTPTQVAAAPAPAPAPAPVAATPTAPVVVAQNNTNAYEQGRRDQERRDIRRNESDRPLPPRADRDQDVPPPRVVAAAACRECGVVESINPVKVEGKTNGTGAVAGGLGGALVGNRIAGGGNRTLGGVVGAVGGGLLGNAIEKHERTATVYDVNVRMSDGSLRTVRESTSPALGEKVRVEADGLHDRS
jgi:outer membrane lipoprotein SlyB